MGAVLKRFGRYFLLDHIAQGGMAEIYRARLAAAGGAGRLMVIKKIQAGYGANTEFLQMFKSEIKVTMGFNHPNIVQLYDFGEESKQPYIAMELVDGKNLRQFISRFAELKQTFPVELATYITEQASSGLHYAHSFKDKITGEPLYVVHRDVSPQNILISYEGNVKVIDFGIAKATTNSESTRAGVIKGKPSYLSPEQISGEVLDGRSDIFALGAVLWELLTGKKLFAGENDLAVLKLIESAQTHVKPPSTVNPKVPKELDYIVLKSLAKQREKRYQSAEELQRALHKFLYGFMPEFNPSDLAYYAKDLFKNEIVEDRKRIQKLNDKVEHLLSLDAPKASFIDDTDPGETKPEESTYVDSSAEERRSASSGGRNAFDLKSIKPSTVEFEGQAPAIPSTTAGHAKPALPNSTSQSQSQRRQSSSIKNNTPIQRPIAPPPQDSTDTFKKIMLAVAAIVVVSIFGPQFGIKVPIISKLLADFVATNEARLVLQGSEKGVVVSVNGQVMSADSLPATLTGLTVGTPFRVTVTGTSGTFEQEVTLRKGEKKLLAVAFSLDRRPSLIPGSAITEKSILLRLNLNPGGGSPVLTINGRSIDASNPIMQVPMDSPLELVVDRTGFKTFKREFVLDSRQFNGLKEWLMDIPLEPLRFGYLSIHTIPSSDANIPLGGGTPWKKRTPIENEKLPVGTYNIRLTNDVLGMEKTITIRIEEGKSLNVEEKLMIGK